MAEKKQGLSIFFPDKVLKKIKNAAAYILIICLLSSPLTMTANAAPGTKARSAVLYEAETDTFLFTKNPDERLPIASITKIMTALVVLENCNPEEHVQFKRQWALTEGSSSGFREGGWYTVRQLLYALMLASGNDAAVALACHAAGSVENFARLMNRKASELGMTNSCFKNPHGLDEKGHYSTATDMAKLAAAAMKNEQFVILSSTKDVKIGKYRFSNHNKLLWKYPNVVGVKTGYTSAAGRTLVTCVKKKGMTLICVTLNDSDDWNDHISLFDWAGANYKIYTLDSRGGVGSLPVISGEKESALLKSERDVKLLLNSGDEVETEISLPRFAYAPVSEYEKAGEVHILVNRKKVDTVQILYSESVPVDPAVPLTFWEKVKWSWRLSNQYMDARYFLMY
jgi:D-alanyl-D-alanine carboxypeptidase